MRLQDHKYGTRFLHADGAPALLFTENDTNNERLFGSPNATPYVKDAFHRYLIGNERAAVNPAERGTKGAAMFTLRIEPGATVTLRARFNGRAQGESQEFGGGFDSLFAQRRHEGEPRVTKSHLILVLPGTASILRMAVPKPSRPDGGGADRSGSITR